MRGVTILFKSRAYESFLRLLEGQAPKEAPVSIWNTRGSVGLPQRVKTIKDYYDNPSLKLEAQLYPLKVFDDVLLIPGVWPDFGVALEASAFGCEIIYLDNNPPVAMHYMKSIKEISKLQPIDPKKDGLMPEALRQYEIMLSQIPKEALEKLDYLDGCSLTTGPLEVSSMILGHTEFYLAFSLYPELVKELLDLVTQGIISYLKALEEISGKIKLLSMIEHLPGQISREHFLEFGLPYISKIFNQFPQAIGLYHNEDNISHIAGDLHKLGAQIIHFGDIGQQSVASFKALLKGDLILMGNIHPLDTLLNGDEEMVRQETRECIAGAGPEILISSGGGLTSGTPRENLWAMIETARAAYQGETI